MKLVRLVRHGRASGGWDDDPDPGLDELGREQAEQVAQRLVDGHVGIGIGIGVGVGSAPPRLVTSPLRRCQETAAPLGRRWGIVPVIEPRVAEIPSPEGVAFGERVPWLRAAMAGTWSALGPRYTAYRDEVVSTIRALPDGAVVVSHFVAINAVIGACLGDDRLLLRSLDNTSITVVGIDDDDRDAQLHLLEAGHEADTLIR